MLSYLPESHEVCILHLLLVYLESIFHCQKSKKWKCIVTISELRVHSMWSSGQRKASDNSRAETIATNSTSSACKNLRTDVYSTDENLFLKNLEVIQL